MFFSLVGICQLATVFQCWRIWDFPSQLSWCFLGCNCFLPIWTLKSAGVTGCHVVLPLISKLSVLWSKTHPYSIKVSQNHSHLLEVFIGFLFIFFSIYFYYLEANYFTIGFLFLFWFFSFWPDAPVFWWKFHLSIKLCLHRQHNPEIKAVTWGWGKSSKGSRFSCWRVKRNQVSGNHKSPGSFHPALKRSFLTPVNLCSICFQGSSEFHSDTVMPFIFWNCLYSPLPLPHPYHAHTHTHTHTHTHM